MTQARFLLDTDTVSLLLRNQPKVLAQARHYISIYGPLHISIITRYEVLKGLKFKGALAQLARFDQFCNSNDVLPLTDAIINHAADIHADLRKRGVPIGDPDVLIAGTAIVNGLTMVTNNERHFGRVAGLQVENWLR